jgi:hypothetical protein
MRAKISLTALLILISLALGACNVSKLDIDPSSFASLEVIDLMDGDRLVAERGSSDYEEAQRFMADFARPFKNDRESRPDDGHRYQFIAYGDEGDILADVIVNEDGSFCSYGRHFVAEDGVGLDIEAYSRFFESRVGDSAGYLPGDVERSGGGRLLVTVGEWNYLGEFVEVNGKNLTVLAREDTAGARYEIIQEYNEVYGDRAVREVEYVAGSYEAGRGEGQEEGGDFLYFSVFNSEDGQREILAFSLVDETCEGILRGSVCSNMVILDGDKMQGIGWVISDDVVTAVNLADGSVDEESSKSIKVLGSFYEIGGSFFGGPGMGYDIQYSEMAAVDDERIEITIMRMSGEGRGEVAGKYIFNCSSGEIEKPDDEAESEDGEA